MRSIVFCIISTLSLISFRFASDAHAVTFNAIQDADAVGGGGYDFNNFGLQTYMSENWAGADSVIAHLEFDVSSLAAGSVISAKLRLYHEYNTVGGTSFDVYRVTSAWNELTLTYDARPTLDGTVYSSLAIADSNTYLWREWDVTSLVQEWADGTSPNFGMAIFRNPDEPVWPYFRSKDNESEGKPELVVERVPEPSTLAPMAWLAACGLLALRARTAFG